MGLIKPATTYFRAMHYHRPQRLNYCVREGNRCDPLGVVTDNARGGRSSPPRTIDVGTKQVNGRPGRPRGADTPAPNTSGKLVRFKNLTLACTRRSDVVACQGQGARRPVGVVKPSTVRTAQLKALLPLHMRPINLVVFQGSFVLRQPSLILRGASRLDAFSVYPCRT